MLLFPVFFRIRLPSDARLSNPDQLAQLGGLLARQLLFISRSREAPDGVDRHTRLIRARLV